MPYQLTDFLTNCLWKSQFLYMQGVLILSGHLQNWQILHVVCPLQYNTYLALQVEGPSFAHDCTVYFAKLTLSTLKIQFVTLAKTLLALNTVEKVGWKNMAHNSSRCWIRIELQPGYDWVIHRIISGVCIYWRYLYDFVIKKIAEHFLRLDKGMKEN